MSLMRAGLVLLFCFSCICSPTSADQIFYGDFNGATVDYLDVTEDNNIPGNNTTQKFGQPQLLVDTLDFDPPNFSAMASSSGAGDFQSDINDATLSMTIMSTPGNFIENIIISEGGDYTLSSGGLGTLASVGAAVRFTIIEVNNAPITPISASGNLVFTPTSASNGTYVVPDDSGTAVLWDGILDFDVAALAANATKVEVVLDNVLRVEADNGGTSFIKKKDFSGVTITVPEPAALFTLVLGVCCLMVARRK